GAPFHRGHADRDLRNPEPAHAALRQQGPVLRDRSLPRRGRRRSVARLYDQDRRVRPRSRRLDRLELPRLQVLGVPPGRRRENGVAMKLSVILPVRDEAPVIPDLIPRLTSALEALDESWEVILVDDGSQDSSWALLEDAAKHDERIRAIRFSR